MEENDIIHVIFILKKIFYSILFYSILFYSYIWCNCKNNEITTSLLNAENIDEAEEEEFI